MEQVKQVVLSPERLFKLSMYQDELKQQIKDFTKNNIVIKSGTFKVSPDDQELLMLDFNYVFSRDTFSDKNYQLFKQVKTKLEEHGRTFITEQDIKDLRLKNAKSLLNYQAQLIKEQEQELKEQEQNKTKQNGTKQDQIKTK